MAGRNLTSKTPKISDSSSGSGTETNPADFAPSNEGKIITKKAGFIPSSKPFGPASADNNNSNISPSAGKPLPAHGDQMAHTGTGIGRPPTKALFPASFSMIPKSALQPAVNRAKS